ncbi:MAG TPA: hypothetical protein VFY81_08725 [Gammaproteobacteria bacterium]|jgi:hypothetical protein|nr:hypothetical protein [Gammaproteobacteria bacterium]
MGEVVQFRRREKPVSTLDLLVESWGEGDAELEQDIRRQCGALLDQYSVLPALSLQLPAVEHLTGHEQSELADALQAQIRQWAGDWHTRMLFEVLGAEILRLRELHGYGVVPGSHH